MDHGPHRAPDLQVFVKAAAVFAALPAITLLAAADIPDTRAIDALFAGYNAANVPGASVAVVHRGRIVYRRGFGRANLEENTPASDATNYRLASVTKQFTAMAAMLLVKDGRLKLDDRAAAVLRDLPAYAKEVRIRHLLNHTSGLPDYEKLMPEGQTEQVKDADVLKLLKTANAMLFDPGSKFQYSNSGYAVLALVIEAVSGRGFAQFLKARIFDPLRMSGTVAFEEGVSVLTNRAYGYTPEGPGFKRTDQSPTSAVLGDGGIYSSITDLVRWDEALTFGKLLTPDLYEQVFTPSSLDGGTKTNYGFGWYIDTYKGALRYRHTGTTVGFRNVIHRFPKERFSVIILSNRSDARPEEIAARIADLTLFR